MQALILAAGKGTRFKKMTQDKPKCMVELNGSTLISRLLSQLDQQKLTKIIIVTGYLSDVLIEYVTSLKITTKIEFINNTEFQSTNNIVSLQKAQKLLVEENTIMFESDLVLSDKAIRRICDSQFENFAVVSPYENWMDGTCTLVNNENKIDQFIPKNQISKFAKERLFKTVNVYKFSREFSKSILFPYLNAQISGFGSNSYYETVLGTIVDIDKTYLEAITLSPEEWYETDNIADLSIASIKFCEDPLLKMKQMESRYGGYWRFPNLKDYAYLVNPFFPTKDFIQEFHDNLNRLVIDYPSGLKVNSQLVGDYYSIDEENIVIGNGAAELIKVLLEQYFQKVGVILPTFEEYPNRISEDSVFYMETQNSDFKYNSSDIIKYFDDKPIDSLILINPDNPSGNFLSKDELLNLCKWSKKKNITIVVDESFSDFSTSNLEVSMLDQDILSLYTNLVVIKSISKSFGVPGVRLGLLASGDSSLITTIKKNVSIWNINSFGEFFLQTIGNYKTDYLNALAKFYKVREKFAGELKQFEYLEIYPSQANYFMIGLKHGVTANELSSYLLSYGNILIKNLENKQGIKGEFIRIAVKTDDENNQLVDALKEFKNDKNY